MVVTIFDLIWVDRSQGLDTPCVHIDTDHVFVPNGIKYKLFDTKYEQMSIMLENLYGLFGYEKKCKIR